jgi:hypothetical protein
LTTLRDCLAPQVRRVSGSWRMAAGRRRSARSRGSEGLCPSRVPKPRSDQHQECSTTDNHGYRRFGGAGPTTSFVVGARGGSDRRRLAVPARAERPGAAAQSKVVRARTWGRRLVETSSGTLRQRSASELASALNRTKSGAFTAMPSAIAVCAEIPFRLLTCLTAGIRNNPAFACDLLHSM